MAEREKPWWEHLIDWVARPMSDWLTLGAAEAGWHQYDEQRAQQDQAISQAVNSAQNGAISGQDALLQIGQSGGNVNATTEQWLNNLISQQNTQADRDYQTQMRDTSYLSAGNQLQALGLSPSGVLSTGGAQAGVSSSAATNSHNNLAMQRYVQQLGMAKQLLGMTSQMASAGIYGSALGAAKKASSVLSAASSHSALSAMYSDGKEFKPQYTWEEMMDILK